MDNSEFTLTITAEVVAWYAATVATISATIQAAHYFRERKKCKVIYRKDYKVAGDPGYPGIYTIVDVINTGRRPFTLTNVGLLYLEGKGAIFTDIKPQLPCLLKEGERAMAMVEQSDIRFDTVRSIEAYDAAGDTFRAAVAPWPNRAYWAIRRRLMKG